MSHCHDAARFITTHCLLSSESVHGFELFCLNLVAMSPCTNIYATLKLRNGKHITKSALANWKTSDHYALILMVAI